VYAIAHSVSGASTAHMNSTRKASAGVARSLSQLGTTATARRKQVYQQIYRQGYFTGGTCTTCPVKI
jgi:hypothetical protein